MTISAVGSGGSTDVVSSGASTGDGTLTLTFTLSETPDGGTFVESDISVTSGTISDFTGSGTTYTATFTPNAAGACSILVAADAFTVSSVGNTVSSTFDWTFTAPTVTISAVGSGGSTDVVSSGASTGDGTLTLTFSLSEIPDSGTFVESDISVTGGAISDFTDSGTTYTATFTPNAAGACSILVAADAFTVSSVGNTVSSTFDWAFTAPTVTCLLYTSPSPRDRTRSRMPSSA